LAAAAVGAEPAVVITSGFWARNAAISLSSPLVEARPEHPETDGQGDHSKRECHAESGRATAADLCRLRRPAARAACLGAQVSRGGIVDVPPPRAADNAITLRMVDRRAALFALLMLRCGGGLFGQLHENQSLSEDGWRCFERARRGRGVPDELDG